MMIIAFHWPHLFGLPLVAFPVIAALTFLAAMGKPRSSGRLTVRGPRRASDGSGRPRRGRARVVGRFIAGRPLRGESDATFWKPGAPAPGLTRRPVYSLGVDQSPLPAAVSLTKSSSPGGDGWVRTAGRIFRTGLSAARGAVAGIRGTLAAWSRWPHAARAAVRLAPFPVAWGLWRNTGTTCVALGLIIIAAFAVAMTGPTGLGLWRRQAPSADALYGPALWVVVRQLFRLEESARRRNWLSLPDEITAEGARIVLRLPPAWIGSTEATNALNNAVVTRLPGEWKATWQRLGANPYVEWTLLPAPKPLPVLPALVPWRDTGNRHEVFVGRAIEGDKVVDAVVRTETATPHWGVGGDTGSGKSTVLYIPVVHTRQHGGVVDILDTKWNSLAEAEGHSGVRVHKTVRACIAAFGEFLASMMGAEAAVSKYATGAARNLLVARTLVIDELPTLIKLAYTWWRHGLRGKGAPPFLDWFGIILLQGRSSNHRVVVGTQQFANGFFDGTIGRAQIGTRILVGAQERVSWQVAFGASTPVIRYDASIPGRGAFTDKRQSPGENSDHLYVREIQPCYITPEVGRLLSACPPAPEWFDRGEMAPWITDEVLAEVNETAAVGDFLPGGQYGPASLPGALPRPPATAGGDDPAAQDLAAEQEEVEQLPATYSLSEACERGILPWTYNTARSYKSRSEERGIPFPEGVTDGGRTFYYSEAELLDWKERFQAHGKP
jgi:hypothetical protein